jgi:hypothetical protein
MPRSGLKYLTASPQRAVRDFKPPATQHTMPEKEEKKEERKEGEKKEKKAKAPRCR